MAASPTAVIYLRPRYFRLYTDPGVELAEENFRYKDLDWRIPLKQVALVCLDVWNWHFAADTLGRIEDITVNVIAPLVDACRRSGLQVIHAPAGPVAQKHPNWVKLIPQDEKPQPVWPKSPTWPPGDFRAKKGVYAQYARPHEPQDQERNQHREKLRDFHPAVRPIGDEAVILNGEELHRLCAQRGILFLFYVGFNTNACIVMRDYGTLAMQQRGYEVILVRDATTGMETHETKPTLACTHGQIASLEQFGCYTVTSRQLIEALGQGCSSF
ncbi:MAG: isochorismatase family protein [Planctomycetes bacterium]|nr:isochorismatase family protein [Planctomycetota bacterium]